MIRQQAGAHPFAAIQDPPNMLSLPRMDREMLQEHLAQAERHISEGECHIARQREIMLSSA